MGVLVIVLSVAGAVATALAEDAAVAPQDGVAACGSVSGSECGTPAASADAGTAPPDSDAAPESAGPANDCCTASAAPGCSAPDVLACVCAGDGFCCSAAYDELCVSQAQSLCGLDCDARPPRSDCCSASDIPGCSQPAVAACVCDIDPFCCAFRFDASCVNLAAVRCGSSCAPEALP